MTDHDTRSAGTAASESMESVRLPGRLRVCAACGEARGWSGREKSVCLCDGVPCCRCGERNVRRPLTSYYDWRDCGWWHVPWFGYMKPCPQCRRSASAPATGGGDGQQPSGLTPAEQKLVDAGAKLIRPETRIGQGQIEPTNRPAEGESR